MLPSIFGENLFDDFFDDDFMRFPAWSGRDPLYGKHAKNLMKTDVRETENTSARSGMPAPAAAASMWEMWRPATCPPSMRTAS